MSDLWQGMSVATGAVCVVCAIMLTGLHRRVLIFALPLVAILQGAALHAGGVAVRPDQVLASCLSATLVLAVLAGQRRLVTDRGAICLLLLALLNVFASVLNSPVPRYSLVEVVNLVSVWMVYVLLINFLDDGPTLEKFMKVYLAAGGIAASIGVGAYALTRVGIKIGGATMSDPNDLSVAYGAYGTMFEPNLFGGLCLMYFILSAGLLALLPRQSMISRRFLRFLVVTSLLGVVLSFTRGAYIGTLAGYGAILVMSSLLGKRRIRWPALLGPLVLFPALVAIATAIPGPVGEFVRYKITNLVNPQAGSGSYRVIVFGLAWQQYLDHPLLGYGTYTFAPLLAQGADFKSFAGANNMWIPNYLLMALHDTGPLGAIVMTVMLGGVVIAAVRTARQVVEQIPRAAAALGALAASLVGMLIAFLTSSGLTYTYPWVLIGLTAALTAWAKHTAAAGRVARVADFLEPRAEGQLANAALGGGPAAQP